MAYDFLGLVNDVNRRLNEVELTSSNFSSATGFYSQIKDSVNSSIRYINQSEFKWPAWLPKRFQNDCKIASKENIMRKSTFATEEINFYVKSNAF